MQLTLPEMSAEMRLMTQVLVGVDDGFGTESGAPNTHPVAVQFRSLPVSAALAEATVAVFVLVSHEAILLMATP